MVYLCYQVFKTYHPTLYSNKTKEKEVDYRLRIQNLIRILTPIKTKRAVKNSNVDHSTRASTPSKSTFSAKMNRRAAPKRADHPRDRFSLKFEWQKNRVMTKRRVNPDFMRSFLSRIGY